MNKSSLAIVLGVALVAAPAWASEKLAQDKQCMGCHQVDKDGAAPSFKKIGAAWKDKKGAEKTMVATIRRGSRAAGGPHWGKATMPDDAERPQVSEAEAKQLARWILKL